MKFNNSIQHFIVLLLVLFIFIPVVSADDFSFDLTAWGIGGVGTYSITESSLSFSELYYYIGGSLYFVFHISNYLAIQPGIAYISDNYKNGSYSIGAGTYFELSLSSIAVPIYLRITTKDEELYAYIGPMMKLLIDAKADASVDIKNNLNVFGLTAVVGVGAAWEYFFFDLSLSYNILDFSDTTTVDNNLYIGFNIGMIFWSTDRP